MKLLATLVLAIGFLLTACYGDPPDTKIIQILQLGYAHGMLSASTKVDVACIAGGSQVEHTVGGGCTCLHLHSQDPGITFKASTLETGTTADQAPGECGHGCLKTIDETEADVLCGGLDIDDPLHPRQGLCLESPCGS